LVAVVAVLGVQRKQASRADLLEDRLDQQLDLLMQQVQHHCCLDLKVLAIPEEVQPRGIIQLAI
jgi:hypothetical protein